MFELLCFVLSVLIVAISMILLFVIVAVPPYKYKNKKIWINEILREE